MTHKFAYPLDTDPYSRPNRDMVKYGHDLVRKKQAEAEQRNVRMSAYHITQADPTNIIQVRKGCCRWCYGTNNEYQRTDWELDRDLNRFIASHKRGQTFNQMGGGGFIKSKEPNENCPLCAGEGENYVAIEDFRKLNERDRHLIAGVKLGKGGHVEEIRFHDKIAAINTFAKIDGMVVEKKVIRVLDATEDDLNRYFAQNAATIDHDDPDFAPFIEVLEGGQEVSVEAEDVMPPGDHVGASPAAEDPAPAASQPESRMARLRRLHEQGLL
jgi:hypothetical protein